MLQKLSLKAEIQESHNSSFLPVTTGTPHIDFSIPGIPLAQSLYQTVQPTPGMS